MHSLAWNCADLAIGGPHGDNVANISWRATVHWLRERTPIFLAFGRRRKSSDDALGKRYKQLRHHTARLKARNVWYRRIALIYNPLQTQPLHPRIEQHGLRIPNEEYYVTVRKSECVAEIPHSQYDFLPHVVSSVEHFLVSPLCLCTGRSGSY